nr:retrovirus-related Pol polyprotein from transposon TNT 1-94 [Tanacetum cinerariifolium]
MEKDSEIYKGKKERTKSIALKDKKESSDDETLTSRSDDEEYVMVVRNLKSYLEERVNLFGNQEKKGSHSDEGMRRKERVIRNVLDALIQVISLAIVQKHLATKIKRLLLEVLGATSRMTPKTKPTTKLVSWLNLQMRTKTMSFVGSFTEKVTDGSTIKGHKSTLPGSVFLRTCLEPDEWIKDSGCSKHMTGNKSLFFTYKAYDGGYSQNSKAYVVLNKHVIKVEESFNVTFDESPPPTKLSPSVDDDVGEEDAIRRNTKIVNTNNDEDESIEVEEIVNIKESKNHPLDQVIGNLNQRNLRSQAQNHCNFFYFIPTIEPKNVKEALKDESWVVAMQELN